VSGFIAVAVDFVPGAEDVTLEPRVTVPSSCMGYTNMSPGSAPMLRRTEATTWLDLRR
jgi:hypothetical protein